MDASGLKLSTEVCEYLKNDIMRIIILRNPNVNREQLMEEIKKHGSVRDLMKLHSEVSHMLEEDILELQQLRSVDSKEMGR